MSEEPKPVIETTPWSAQLPAREQGLSAGDTVDVTGVAANNPKTALGHPDNPTTGAMRAYAQEKTEEETPAEGSAITDVPEKPWHETVNGPLIAQVAGEVALVSAMSGQETIAEAAGRDAANVIDPLAPQPK